MCSYLDGVLLVNNSNEHILKKSKEKIIKSSSLNIFTVIVCLLCVFGISNEIFLNDQLNAIE